jgi:3'-phosphoadenosine 5'-phosphosulfate (PAPS) 3'-phosphatase
MPDLDAIHDVLVEAVLAGAREIMAVKSGGVPGARIKYGRELVTEADERSDAAILSVFHARFPLLDPEISFHLEESGASAAGSNKVAGADPLDGTAHFACGGNLYAVQAHYVEDGVPQVGVVFQPEVYLPLAENPRCLGRFVTAIRGRGAFHSHTEFTSPGFVVHAKAELWVRPALRAPATMYVACVPVSTKMTPAERARAQRVYESGIMSATVGAGCAGGNVMMTIFGGQHVYANFGAGEDLDLAPPQVIAEESGLTVWGTGRSSPLWRVRKQPVVVAPSPEVAERVLQAAGL